MLTKGSSKRNVSEKTGLPATIEQINFYTDMMLKRICWVFTFMLAATLTMQAGPTKEAGKDLFVANCASCHNKNMKDNLTGPALGGLEDRWAAYPRKDLYSWIRNSQALIATGHPRATELWGKWKPVAMNSFPGLTDEQMESMILYINDQYTNAGKVAVTPGTPVDG